MYLWGVCVGPHWRSNHFWELVLFLHRGETGFLLFLPICTVQVTWRLSPLLNLQSLPPILP